MVSFSETLYLLLSTGPRKSGNRSNTTENCLLGCNLSNGCFSTVPTAIKLRAICSIKQGGGIF